MRLELCLLFGCLALPAFAATQPTSPVAATPAFVEMVTLAPSTIIGQTPVGFRLRVPITGGTFKGPGLFGVVLPGGADWQLRRADGSLHIEADYMIETNDHTQIHVSNIGVSVPPHDGQPHYIFAAPTFEAPMGHYGWLNDAIFVSTITPAGDKSKPAVKISIYRIDSQKSEP